MTDHHLPGQADMFDDEGAESADELELEGDDDDDDEDFEDDDSVDSFLGLDEEDDEDA